MENKVHIPILKNEVIKNLITDINGTYCDGTLGFGGHSEATLDELGENGKLYGIDRDKEALEYSKKRLAKFGDRFTAIHGNYKDIEGYLKKEGVDLVDGILLDCGISSYQIDQPQRGFSYVRDAKLDMRMNQDQELSAYTVVNTYEQRELARVLRVYGEEKFANQIAARIVKVREEKPIETTKELADLIKEVIPMPARRKGGNPSKRSFQGIRIEVNQELEGLREAIMTMIGMLKPGGRLCVISFHSLEDRAIKQAMREAEDPCTCPKDIPYCICGKVSMGKAVPRKGIVPSQEEMEENPRSKSARLRVFVKK